MSPFLSSRLGSIALNDDGGQELYRASKSALNSFAHSFAIKDALRAGISLRALHPGWVKTDMGGEAAPLTIAESVQGLRKVIIDATGKNDFRYLDYQGENLAW